MAAEPRTGVWRARSTTVGFSSRSVRDASPNRAPRNDEKHRAPLWAHKLPYWEAFTARIHVPRASALFCCVLPHFIPSWRVLSEASASPDLN